MTASKPRTPMREYRLAEKSLKNAKYDYHAAGLALQACMKREREAFFNLDAAQRRKVLLP